MSIERYDCTNGGAQFCSGCYTMTPRDDGEWVSFDDYQALQAERDDLRRQLEQAGQRGEQDAKQ
jgi:hypothetical protein